MSYPSHASLADLRQQHTAKLNHAKTVLARVKARGDEWPSQHENDEMSADLEEVNKLDRQIKGRELVHSVTSLGSADAHPERTGSVTCRSVARRSRATWPP